MGRYFNLATQIFEEGLPELPAEDSPLRERRDCYVPADPSAFANFQFIEKAGLQVTHVDWFSARDAVQALKLLTIIREEVTTVLGEVEVVGGRVTGKGVLDIVDCVFEQQGWPTYLNLGGGAVDLGGITSGPTGSEHLQQLCANTEVGTPFVAFNTASVLEENSLAS